MIIKDKIKKIVAAGDCNTLGIGELRGKSFPERFGDKVGAEVHNAGHTMATTREGIHILRDNIGDADCILIQYGLADSYRTFKYAPYVLYYPDTFVRKLCRRLVKKYKKICRKNGLNDLLGQVNTVSPAEYENNLRQMIASTSAQRTFVIDILPNKRLYLNDDIVAYNEIITGVCNDFAHCSKIGLYDVFNENLDNYYLDETHCNAQGYEHIAQRIYEEL